jgi:hypothetical protein
MTPLVVTLLIVGALLAGGALLLNALLRRWIDSVATYAEGIGALLEGNERALGRVDAAAREGLASQNGRLDAEAQALLAQLSDPPPGALQQLWFGFTPSALRWQQIHEPLERLYGRAQELAQQIEHAAAARSRSAATQPMGAADATQPMGADVTRPMPVPAGLLSPAPGDGGALRHLLARASAALAELPPSLDERAAMRAALLDAEQKLAALPADDAPRRAGLAQQLERLHAGAQRLGLDYTRLTAGLPLLRALLEDRRAALAVAGVGELPFGWGDTAEALEQLAREAARAAELPPTLTHDGIKERLGALHQLHARERALAARIDHALAQRDALAALLRRPELAADRPWLRSILSFDRHVGSAETAALVAATSPLVQQHDALLANVATLREDQIAERYAEAVSLREAVHGLGLRARAMAHALRAA